MNYGEIAGAQFAPAPSAVGSCYSRRPVHLRSGTATRERDALCRDPSCADLVGGRPSLVNQNVDYRDMLLYNEIRICPSL